MLSDTVETNALEEMVEAITAAGIVVEMYHAEAAPGQVSILCAFPNIDSNLGMP